MGSTSPGPHRPDRNRTGFARCPTKLVKGIQAGKYNRPSISCSDYRLNDHIWLLLAVCELVPVCHVRMVIDGDVNASANGFNLDCLWPANIEIQSELTM